MSIVNEKGIMINDPPCMFCLIGTGEPMTLISEPLTFDLGVGCSFIISLHHFIHSSPLTSQIYSLLKGLDLN